MALPDFSAFVSTFLNHEKEDAKRLIRHEMESMLDPLVESLFAQLKAKLVDYLEDSWGFNPVPHPQHHQKGVDGQMIQNPIVNDHQYHSRSFQSVCTNNAIGKDSISTKSTTNPTQPNLAKSKRHPKCPLKCPHCPKSFDIKSKLKRHLLVHTGERPFQCDQCDKCFSQAGNLAKHQRIHENIKLYHCDQCDKQFTESGGLVRHKLTHQNVKRFQCEECGKEFTQKSHLEEHEQAKHLHVKPYRCKTCGFTCARSSNIVKHVRMVHFSLPHTVKEQQELNIIDHRDPWEFVEKLIL